MLNIFKIPENHKPKKQKSSSCKQQKETTPILVNTPSKPSVCYYCKAPDDGKTVLNQIIFTVPTKQGYGFKYLYLCSHCQEVAYNKLHLLPQASSDSVAKVNEKAQEPNQSPKKAELPASAVNVTPSASAPQIPLAASSASTKDVFTDRILSLVRDERIRQIQAEGYDSDHDKRYVRQEIARAAATYILPEKYRGKCVNDFPFMYPWNRDTWKPTPNNRLRELVKGLALAVAEVERLARLHNYDSELGISNQDAEVFPPDQDAGPPAVAATTPDLTPLLRLIEYERALFVNLCRGKDWKKADSKTAHFEKAKEIIDWLFATQACHEEKRCCRS